MVADDCYQLSTTVSPCTADWFMEQPLPGANVAQIVNWFRQQPAATAAAGDGWFRGQPAPDTSDAEIAEWFRGQSPTTASGASCTNWLREQPAPVGHGGWTDCGTPSVNWERRTRGHHTNSFVVGQLTPLARCTMRRVGAQVALLHCMNNALAGGGAFQAISEEALLGFARYYPLKCANPHPTGCQRRAWTGRTHHWQQ
jgi:hypothetical protein